MSEQKQKRDEIVLALLKKKPRKPRAKKPKAAADLPKNKLPE